MNKLRLRLEIKTDKGFEKLEERTFKVDDLKLRRFQEIFKNDISELRKVELCPIPEAKEYEEDHNWPIAEGV